MRKPIHVSLSVLLLSLLQACGGGGDDKASPAPPAAEGIAAAGADIGSVSARLVPTETRRFLLFSASGHSILRGESEQTDSGAMVRLGSATLSGSRQTVDITGDAHYALGRWLKGTVTRSSQTETLNGDNHKSYHYLAFNGVTALPTIGQAECKTVAATAPTANSDRHAKLGSASGSGTMVFSDRGTSIRATIQVRVVGESAPMALSAEITDVEQTSYSGLLLAQGPGAALMLADQGSPIPGLVMGYRAQLPGGTFYTGVARFSCTKK
ncbi:hypothetical protein [Comamonas endophytica]|uniref:Lipoprotein n=1 Tax=Comamonas endophytica TaxID=2949090 RepID=A0ABY6G894_9BURK|nr:MULTISPECIES: hypothetical protein [unclassified Acidovorax]MCD2514104.1 hypothetical protein [Acidovorax sp. D4N7]UYG51245.1 hypothetical protein M9799_14410 [Acidovorax sp. 5MLIR]